MISLFNIIFTFLLIPKRVILHLEKIPDGITHTGISFKNSLETRRYDFRPFNENCSCLTTGIDRKDPRVIFPNIYNDDFDPRKREYFERFYTQNPEIIYRDVILGSTTKTFEEIDLYSQELNKKYILCIYDCSHYVDNFAVWAGVGHIPIWRLSRYFKDND